MFGNMELKNYWTVFANARAVPARSQDDRATRGGPSMRQPSAHNESIGIESDGRKPVSVGAESRRPASERGRHGTEDVGLNVRYRPASSLEISAGPNFQRTHNLVAVRRHLRGSGRGRHLRLALHLLDPRSAGVQPPDQGQLRDVAEDVAPGLHAAAGVGGALHRLQAVRAPAHVRLHAARQRSRAARLRSDREALHRRTRPTAAPRSGSTIPTSTSSRCG